MSVGSIPRRTQPAPGAPPTHTGVIELRAAFAIELVGQEIRRLQRRVPLRRHVVEAHAVVERQTAVGLPVVLRVPLDVLVAPFGQRVLRGLLVDVEHAGRRVRVAEPGVEGVARVVHEVDLAVEAREDALRLEAVLKVEPDLRGMRAPHLRQVRDDVVGDVLIGERAAIGLVLAGIARCRAAAEDEPRHVVGLDGVGKQQRQRRHARVRTEQLLLAGVEVQRVRRRVPSSARATCWSSGRRSRTACSSSRGGRTSVGRRELSRCRCRPTSSRTPAGCLPCSSCSGR